MLVLSAKSRSSINSEAFWEIFYVKYEKNGPRMEPSVHRI